MSCLFLASPLLWGCCVLLFGVATIICYRETVGSQRPTFLGIAALLMLLWVGFSGWFLICSTFTPSSTAAFTEKVWTMLWFYLILSVFSVVFWNALFHWGRQKARPGLTV